MTLACRRTTPPGFRAAPRAIFAVTAMRFQSFTPPRLRPCALRLSQGATPSSNGRGLRSYAPACCSRLCKSVPSSTLSVRRLYVPKDSSPTRRPASPYGTPRHASSTSPQAAATGVLGKDAGPDKRGGTWCPRNSVCTWVRGGTARVLARALQTPDTGTRMTTTFRLRLTPQRLAGASL